MAYPHKGPMMWAAFPCNHSKMHSMSWIIPFQLWTSATWKPLTQLLTCAEGGILRQDAVYTLAADKLAPCVARSAVSMALFVYRIKRSLSPVTWWCDKWKQFPCYWPFVRGIQWSSQRPVTRSFNVFFVLRQNKWLGKQSRRWWFETQSRSLWCHCNENLL